MTSEAASPYVSKAVPLVQVRQQPAAVGFRSAAACCVLGCLGSNCNNWHLGGWWCSLFIKLHNAVPLRTP